MKTYPLSLVASVPLALLVSAGLAGCEFAMDLGEIPADGRMFTRLQSVTMNEAYRNDRFSMINEAAYPTDLSDTDMINVFVNESAAAAYATLDPQVVGTQIRLALGSVIIREVLRDGELTKLTTMIKGPPGYFPEGGDYFYAVTSVDGQEILLDELGNSLAGPLVVCGGCHSGRAQDDFLFGVAGSVQGYH